MKPRLFAITSQQFCALRFDLSYHICHGLHSLLLQHSFFCVTCLHASAALQLYPFSPSSLHTTFEADISFDKSQFQRLTTSSVLRLLNFVLLQDFFLRLFAKLFSKIIYCCPFDAPPLHHFLRVFEFTLLVRSSNIFENQPTTFFLSDSALLPFFCACVTTSPSKLGTLSTLSPLPSFLLIVIFLPPVHRISLLQLEDISQVQQERYPE